MTEIPTTTRPITLPDETPEYPTFGFNPEKCPRLIAKFRAMDPAQRAEILGEQEQA